MAKTITREQWLNLAATFMADKFKETGKPLPEKLHVSCGFPTKGAVSGKIIGQCFYPEVSSEAFTEVFIHPKLSDSQEVAAVLAHELCHAALGPGFGHRKEFKTLAYAMMLTGPATATVGSEEFNTYFLQFIDKHGSYPHSAMTLAARAAKPKAESKNLNLRCPECNYYARTTDEFLSQGRLRCPIHKSQILLTVEERRELGIEEEE